MAVVEGYLLEAAELRQVDWQAGEYFEERDRHKEAVGLE